MRRVFNHAIRWEFTDRNPIPGPTKRSGVRVSVKHERTSRLTFSKSKRCNCCLGLGIREGHGASRHAVPAPARLNQPATTGCLRFHREVRSLAAKHCSGGVRGCVGLETEQLLGGVLHFEASEPAMSAVVRQRSIIGLPESCSCSQRKSCEHTRRQGSPIRAGAALSSGD